MDSRIVDLFIKRHGREAYSKGEAGETLERISQRAEEYNPEFLKKHPEIKGKQIVVYHDPIVGEDLAVIDFETGKTVEILSPELASPLSKGPNPTQVAVLKRLGDYKIIEVHSDGDLTVQVGAHSYVVTTEGEIFVHHAGAPKIHETITENPDPTKFMPIEVTSAFPEGAVSALTNKEKAAIDRLIEAVPDENDTIAINYWVDMGDKRVYLEGWCDKCLAGTGYPEMGGGEWQAKIDYMVSNTKRTLIEKQEEKNRPIGFYPPGHLNLIEGGFREFEAGEKANLYGVSWGVYKKPAKHRKGNNNGHWPEGWEFNPLAEAIDLRENYDEKASVDKGTLYRKGSVIQVWWDKWGKETWSGPDEKEAKRNFQAMKERWTDLVSAQTIHRPRWDIKMIIAYTAGLKDAEEGKPNQQSRWQYRDCYCQGYDAGKGRKYIGPPLSSSGINYLPDSPEYLAETIANTGWRERLDREFQLAVDRTQGG